MWAKAALAWSQVKRPLTSSAPLPSAARSVLVDEHLPQLGDELGPVGGQQPGIPVDHRLASAAGGGVGHGRGEGERRLTDHQAPPLLERGQGHHPRLLVDRALGRLVDVTGEDHVARAHAPRRTRAAPAPTSRCPPPSGAGRAAGCATRARRRWRARPACAAPAVRRRRRWGARTWAGPGLRAVGAVMHDRDPRPVDTELDELAPRGARDRDVLAGAVQTRCEPSLDPPADPSGEPGVHDRPLLAVHVVDQDDHGPSRDQPREEGEPVLHVDDDVDRTQLAAAQRQDPWR